MISAFAGNGGVASREPRRVTYFLSLLIDFWLDEPRQVSQRLLPAEIAGLRWNYVWQAFLNDVQLGAERDFPECHCHLNLTWQVGVVESVCVAQAFMGYELDILAAERVAVARGKIPERHPKSATDFCVQLMHGTRKAIGRQPLGQLNRLAGSDSCHRHTRSRRTSLGNI
jgi:hypothetical protein